MQRPLLTGEVTSLFHDGIAIRNSVSDVVLETLLHAVHTGKLLPGARVNDGQLAQELGVSRTPVREALQRMKEMGLVETVPNRYTRIVDMDVDALTHSLRVWEGLYTVLVREVLAYPLADDVPDRLTLHSDDFASSMARRDPRSAARANHQFFAVLMEYTTNNYLARGIEAVVHVIHLGSIALPKWVNTQALHRAQCDFTTAVARRDPSAAKRAVHDAATVVFVPR